MVTRPELGRGEASVTAGPRPNLLVPRGKERRRRRSFAGWLRGLLSSSRPRRPASDPPPQKGPREVDPEFDQRSTVQMLPGRLEPLDPTVFYQEVRFIRAPAPVQQVTLGWELGDPPGHVTLDHASIRPIHARMTLREDGWWIEGMHPFDPLEVNGTLLDSSHPPRRLEDGDEVRLGSVSFRFRYP